MTTLTRVPSALVICATLLCAGAAGAAPTPQQQCDKARIKAWGKYQFCIDKVVAKNAAKGGEVHKPFAKCRHKYFGKWTKFQTTGSLAGSTCIGSRYTDNGDQTVTDNLSGLVWEKKDDLAGIHDKDNVYTWSTGSPYKENGTVFTSFLDTVNGGGGFAGANGWRLPTLAELQTNMLDFACTGAVIGPPTCSCPSNPCIDPALGVANTQSVHQSARSYIPDSSNEWSVEFSLAIMSATPKTSGISVRAVRGSL